MRPLFFFAWKFQITEENNQVWCDMVDENHFLIKFTEQLLYRDIYCYHAMKLHM